MDPSAAPAKPQPRTPRAVTWSIAALALIGAAIRAWRLERSEFWLDEACSALFASAGDTSAVLQAMARDVHPPLHVLLLHLWSTFFGLGEASLRAPSLLAGVGLVALLPVVVRNAGGGALAQVLAAAAMALSPWLVHYSTEARVYALLALLATALVTCLQAARGGDRRWLAAASALLAALSLSHHHGVLLSGLFAVAALQAPAGQRRWPLAAGALGLLPWALWASATLAGQANHGGAWLAAYWHGPVDAILGTLAMCVGLTPFPSWLAELGAVALPGPVAVAVAVILGLPVLWLLLPRCDPAAETRVGASTALLWAALALPMVGAALISLWRPIYLIGRYDLLVAPAFAALAALGLERLVALVPLHGAKVRGAKGHGAKQRRAEAGALALLLQLGAWLTLLLAYLAVPAPPPVHQATATLLAGAAADDVVLVVGLPWAPLEVALRARADAHVRRPFPSSLLDEPGQLNLRGVAVDALRADAQVLVAALPTPALPVATATAEVTAPSVWLVAALGDDGALAAPRLTQLLVEPMQAAGWHAEPATTLPGLVVHRFVRGVDRR